MQSIADFRHHRPAHLIREFLVNTIFAVILSTSIATYGAAQDHEHDGAPNVGAVHFVTSCNTEAQSDVDRAVTMLHSFQFSRAIGGFDAALGADSTCAIACWGIALADWSNPFAPGAKDKGQLALGRQSVERGARLGAQTDRERAYLGGVGTLYGSADSVPQSERLRGYRDAMRRVATRYPEDREAQIFYALALAVAADPGDKTYADRLDAGAILEKLFAQDPTHPGLAHYIIHAYDVPALAGRAQLAAQRYAQIAPDAPHALHMPSHTFTRLGYWQESIDSNIAAAAAARRQGQTAEELHASDYEAYAYLQTGQDAAAARLVAALPDMAARFDPKALLIGAGPPAAGYFALAAIPARYALERQDWRQAEGLTPTETPFPYADAMTWFARGLGAARLSHGDAAGKAMTALNEIQEHLSAAGETYWAQQVEIQSTALAGWSALASGRKTDALRQMERAVALEDGTDKSVLTSGPLSPARELLGEMLLRMNDPGKALVQFEATLVREPRRFRSLYGAAIAAKRSGRGELSRQYFGTLLTVCSLADKPGRPEIEEALRALAGAQRPRQS